MKINLLIFFLLLAPKLLGQKINNIQKYPKLEVGVMRIYNRLNSDKYFEYKYSYADDYGDATVAGVNIKLTMPSNLEYMDFVLGSLFIKGLNAFYMGNINPTAVNAHDYQLNGGGVYFGVSPGLKGKYIGFTTDFGIGIFSFKENVSIVNNTRQPYVDIHDLKSSYGPGAITSAGLYLNIWKLGVHPSVIGIFSGGANASFFFYGFNLPVTFQF